LAREIRRLSDRLRELEITVVADRPPTRDAAIVDRFECAVDDMRGWVEEALAGAQQAERAVDHPPDLEAARRGLTVCQERFRRAERVFASSLISYESVADLTAFGKERTGEWPSWVASVKQGIDHCREPIDDAANALAACWEEIAGRVGLTSISV